MTAGLPSARRSCACGRRRIAARRSSVIRCAWSRPNISSTGSRTRSRNYLARLVVSGEDDASSASTVDLVAEMAVYNPFDFFLEPHAEQFPFVYTTGWPRELAPYLADAAGDAAASRRISTPMSRERKQHHDFLVELNQRLQKDISYLIRMEPGVQTPEETLTNAHAAPAATSGWLLVQILRHLGLAARFVSGYLIQLKPDVKALDGPTGTEVRFHRSARLVRSLSARRGLDRARSRPRACWRAKATFRWPARPSLRRPRRSAARSRSARSSSSTT